MVILNNNRLTDLVIKSLLVLFIVVVALPVRFINYMMELKTKSRVTILIVLGLSFCAVQTAMAQGLKQFANEYQLGFESSFGINSFKINSNIPEINNLNVVGEGGTIGIVCGAKGVVAKVRQGFFYSASSVAHTIDEMRSTAILNVYPLHFLNAESRLRPYLLLSIERSGYRMHGYYDGGDHSKRNYSVSEAPFLGKISAVQSGIGGGLEYRIKTPGHFVALFAETRYSKAIRVTSSNNLFSQTRSSGQLMMNLGVAFGYYR